MGAAILIARSLLPQSLTSLLILIVTGIVVYFVSILTLVGGSLIDDAKKSVSVLFKK